MIDGLVEVEEAAAYCQVCPQKLRNWSETGYAPHYTFDGKGPYFKRSEIRAWVKDNLIQFNAGMPIPRVLNVLSPHAVANGNPEIPFALASMQNLCCVAITAGCPGIYFLCDGPDVVYVGQSVMVVGRIATHIAEGKKKFDLHRVFYIPCPPENLLAVESMFIQQLKPKYNGGMFGPPTDRT